MRRSCCFKAINHWCYLYILQHSREHISSQHKHGKRGNWEKELIIHLLDLHTEKILGKSYATHLFPDKLLLKIHFEIKTLHKQNSSTPPSLTMTKKQHFNTRPLYIAAKYSLLSLGSGFMDFSPGFHPAGQTSSGFSCTYCKACKTNQIKMLEVEWRK